MPKEIKHTELPWKTEKLTTASNQIVYISGNEERIAWIKPIIYSDEKTRDANAEFICKAVNNHYRLVEACKLVRSMLSVWSLDPHKSQNTLLILIEPLDKALANLNVER